MNNNTVFADEDGNTENSTGNTEMRMTGRREDWHTSKQDEENTR